MTPNLLFQMLLYFFSGIHHLFPRGGVSDIRLRDLQVQTENFVPPAMEYFRRLCLHEWGALHHVPQLSGGQLSGQLHASWHVSADIFLIQFK